MKHVGNLQYITFLKGLAILGVILVHAPQLIKEINPLIREFLHAGAVAVGVGGNLVDIQLIQQKRYSELAVKAKEFHRQISWKVDK